MTFWKKALAAYVRKKRKAAKKSQKQLPGGRTTVSAIENGHGNPELDTLFSIMEVIGGDISEAFRRRSSTPTDNPHADAIEKLQRILEAGGNRAIAIIANLDEFYDGLVRDLRDRR